jgi:hypothetical protein
MPLSFQSLLNLTETPADHNLLKCEYLRNGENMRKVASHTHYVTGPRSEDESGLTADNSMHPEFGHTGGHPDTVTTIGARFASKAPAPKVAPKAKKAYDEE